jgi:hypothetical protein
LQGAHADRALRADEKTLVNMLGLVEWDKDPVQVLPRLGYGSTRLNSGSGPACDD